MVVRADEWKMNKSIKSIYDKNYYLTYKNRIRERADQFLKSHIHEPELSPSIGDIRKGWELGHPCSTPFIYMACVDCGETRWVRMRGGKPSAKRCVTCRNKQNRGEKSYSWKGGRTLSWGYYRVRLPRDDFFFPMAHHNGYVPEHRLVMAKHLNRCLLPWEVVHHKNGNKLDNRIENLALLSCNNAHNKELNRRIKSLEKQLSELQNRVLLLEIENLQLKMNPAQRI